MPLPRGVGETADLAAFVGKRLWMVMSSTAERSRMVGDPSDKGVSGTADKPAYLVGDSRRLPHSAHVSGHQTGDEFLRLAIRDQFTRGCFRRNLLESERPATPSAADPGGQGWGLVSPVW